MVEKLQFTSVIISIKEILEKFGIDYKEIRYISLGDNDINSEIFIEYIEKKSKQK